MPAAEIDIHALSPERLLDFLAFFDGNPFDGNPEWSSCYCQCYYEDHARISWSSRTAAQNRAYASARVAKRAMHGHLAYKEGRVVGWCNAAPRQMLHALDSEPVPNAEEVGSIVCFLVAPTERGQGVARALLAAACDGFRAQGIKFAEANPRPHARSSGENHYGPLNMYLAAGFSVQSKDPDGSVWVRLRL